MSKRQLRFVRGYVPQEAPGPAHSVGAERKEEQVALVLFQISAVLVKQFQAVLIQQFETRAGEGCADSINATNWGF